METYNLEAKSIKPGNAIKVREEKRIPAVIYGKTTEPQSLSVDYSFFQKVYKEAGESTLVDLKIDEKESTKVLIQDIQLDPVSGDIIHIDFKAITMGEKMKVNIPLEFVGESLAVKDLKGVLVTNIDELEVECLPKDLISEIKVDISVLKTFEDMIRIRDIKVPDTLEIFHNPDDTVILVAPQREEEKEIPVVTEDIPEPELVGKGKKEEEETPAEEKKKEKK